MLLTLLGFGMVLTFMTLIMTRRLSPLVALIIIPIVFALVGGFGPTMGAMMLEGIRKIAPTGVMLMFAILYFGVMIHAGLFDPVVGFILKLVKGDPLKIVMGSAALALLISLDGDGSTTYMITIASMLPLYKRLKMNPLNLTCVALLASGIMNLTPWGGPTARAASALHVDPGDVFVPMVPAMGIAILSLMAIAFWLGLRERRRLGRVALPGNAQATLPGAQGAQGAQGDDESTGEHLPTMAGPETADLRRPRLLWVNFALTTALMVTLVMGLLPLPVLFMIGFAIAMVINYPNLAHQRHLISEYSGNALAVVALIFAAGIFTGILSGTGMVEAMSRGLLAAIPPSLGPYLPTLTALLSMPLTFFMSNDAFYFGVLPILNEAAQGYGISAVEMARASLIGQPVHLLSPLVPSTYLLVSLAGVDFGDHQRFTLKWAVLVCLALMAACLAMGLFSLVGHALAR
ncbi:CitMHS family transporter [Acidovorax sp. FG27]|uniref:CitMHS family transporter n=1 Tax=Acidovorax sp. FG27 TaxID=3133652 RepID=UPI0030E8DE3B